MNRRSFLKLGVYAPAVILTPGLLMPVKTGWKSLLTPELIVREFMHKQADIVALGTNSIEGNFAKALWPGVKGFWDNVYAVEVRYFEHELEEPNA